MKLKLILSSLFAVGAMVTSSFAMAAASRSQCMLYARRRGFPKIGGNLGNQSVFIADASHQGKH